jgi:hypothetical protein
LIEYLSLSCFWAGFLLWPLQLFCGNLEGYQQILFYKIQCMAGVPFYGGKIIAMIDGSNQSIDLTDKDLEIYLDRISDWIKRELV